MAAGNYGGRISLLTCRKQNFKRLSPGSLTQTHTHSTPLCLLSLPPPWLLTHTLLQWTSSALACVCVPPEATWWIVSMTSVALSFGPRPSSLIYFRTPLALVAPAIIRKGSLLQWDVSIHIQVSSPSSPSKSSWWLLSDACAIHLSSSFSGDF